RGAHASGHRLVLRCFVARVTPPMAHSTNPTAPPPISTKAAPINTARPMATPTSITPHLPPSRRRRRRGPWSSGPTHEPESPTLRPPRWRCTLVLPPPPAPPLRGGRGGRQGPCVPYGSLAA